MYQLNIIRFLSLSLFFLNIFYQPVFAADSKIDYDRKEKILTIEVEEVSLQYLLGMISQKTGFEILTEDDFNLESKISVDMSGPIHQLMPRIFREMSVVVYDSGDSNKSTISILPQGDDESRYLSIGKSVRPVVVSNEDTAEDLEKRERRRDIGREAWQLKKAKEREERRRNRTNSELESK